MKRKAPGCWRARLILPDRDDCKAVTKAAKKFLKTVADGTRAKILQDRGDAARLEKNKRLIAAARNQTP